MKVISKKEPLRNLLDYLRKKPSLSLDTETYGLGWSDRLFSLIIADGDEEYYFNFNNEPDCTGVRGARDECILDRKSVFEELSTHVFSSPNILWFMHNAKFDMRRLCLEGCTISGVVHDTEVCERLINNIHMSYKLSSIAKLYGYEKDTKVEDFIKEYKLYTTVRVVGKSAPEKHMHYDKVPFELITKYGGVDARITYDIGIRQREKLLSFRD